ncbi:Retrovirus-related Pol polyprotein from transposon TNT 1-94 [Araneus ventricosus]|uniref:Retrovirus-related Pol polyprotein from transposon TNT 1-94 n=3 Tax=Araneus ventricosus TaxID=182803 RepID=A0A4Y2M6T2_ARAVE|nr:Retrovirus-related Pol polyprotein from transposon TNT 1-94 [Araneus ventricosus]
MHQNDYINKICELYKEFNFPVSSLPIAKGTVLSKLQCPSTSVEITEMKNYPYRSLLGSLSYIASRTRPDISYAVNILSQFQENPGIIHWNILLKLLGYLSTTRGLQLNLSRVSDLNVECYSDADFAANRDDRVSIGGFIILLDEVPISWRTSKQKCISLSTMEAEYVSLTDASKELLWIQRILEECKKILISKAIVPLQNYLKNLEAWLVRWKIKLNVDKTEAILFYKKNDDWPKVKVYGTPIEWKKEVKYLGVVLDKQLNFRAHTSLIKEKYNKAFRAQYSLICRNSSLNLNNKVLIYLAYLRPILTYASPIWACTARSNLRSIQVLENKTLRIIANARWYHRNIDIRNALNVPSLQQFIQKLAKIFYGKLPDINNPEITKIPVMIIMINRIVRDQE